MIEKKIQRVIAITSPYDLQKYLRYLRRLLHKQWSLCCVDEVGQVLGLFDKIDPILAVFDQAAIKKIIPEQSPDPTHQKIYMGCIQYNKKIIQYLQAKKENIRQEFLRIQVDKELLRLQNRDHD